VHNNYYFLRQLSLALENILLRTVISECFSQSKDELVIRFETSDKPFFIKANLLPSFSCLSFPDDFHRARKNSVDLFDQLIGQRVQSVRQFKNERSFALILSNDMALLFKMHGNRSNIILFEKEKPIDLFKSTMTQDADTNLSSLDREIDWSFESFVQHRDKIQSFYFTFGKPVWKHLDDRHFGSLPPEQQWETIQHVVRQLENPQYYLISREQSLVFSLLPVGPVVKEFKDPIRAITEFYYAFIQQQAFQQERLSVLSSLRSKLEGSESYYRKNLEKLAEIENDHNYKVWADLLMANLHALKSGIDKVVLTSFYPPFEPVEIKLKKELAPQKNAAIYYRKAKNQHIEIERLQKALEGKQKEIETLNAQLEKAASAADLKALRTYVQQSGLKPQEKKQMPSLPYHEFEHKGFRIWVGKNAQSNDELTLRHSYKEDLWLHAKDVAGSHVLIKHQSGKVFPKDVIERAAQLAAYYSKRKNESMCPVAVTPKKFVRKRKGDPAGMVVVEREEVIMVEAVNPNPSPSPKGGRGNPSPGRERD
jgi:predicted ribosome quality control (RQC) complex YloA/Tae2 family protein